MSCFEVLGRTRQEWDWMKDLEEDLEAFGIKSQGCR